ncbi:unnamed protein product [Closterium sp. Naga37s-1]|nr:unnamed protein product [Closterium sp. Naga37s-1]
MAAGRVTQKRRTWCCWTLLPPSPQLLFLLVSLHPSLPSSAPPFLHAASSSLLDASPSHRLRLHRHLAAFRDETGCPSLVSTFLHVRFSLHASQPCPLPPVLRSPPLSSPHCPPLSLPFPHVPTSFPLLIPPLTPHSLPSFPPSLRFSPFFPVALAFPPCVPSFPPLLPLFPPLLPPNPPPPLSPRSHFPFPLGPSSPIPQCLAMCRTKPCLHKFGGARVQQQGQEYIEELKQYGKRSGGTLF